MIAVLGCQGLNAKLMISSCMFIIVHTENVHRCHAAAGLFG